MADVKHSDLSGAELHDPKAHTHDTLYLKRGDDDFGSVGTEKAVPINADRILIEDSALGNAKKWAQLGNLPGGGGSSTWIGLTDTEPSFNGHAGEYVKVNAGADGLDFGSPSGVGSLDDLSDVTITAPATGHTIIHDGVDFKNTNIDTRIMATKLDDFATPNDNEDLNSSTFQHGLLRKLGSGSTNFLREDGTWAPPPGAAGGEPNTASNQGLSGVGMFKTKDTFDLQFKNIDASSNKISITDNTGDITVAIDVVPANIALDTLGVTTDNILLNSTTAKHGLLPKLGGGTSNFLCADGVWREPPGAAGGEVNTASNVGTAGVGVFKQKTGADLEFKKINAGSSNITITDDVANNEVDIDVSTNVFLCDGSRAMGNDLNMDNHAVKGITHLYAQTDTAWTEWQAGTSGGYGPKIQMYGVGYAGGSLAGNMYVAVPNAAGNSLLSALTIVGKVDAPKITVGYGLDMNSKNIENVGKIRASSDQLYVTSEDGNTNIAMFKVFLGFPSCTMYGPLAMEGNQISNTPTIASSHGENFVIECSNLAGNGTIAVFTWDQPGQHITLSHETEVDFNMIYNHPNPDAGADVANKHYADNADIDGGTF